MEVKEADDFFECGWVNGGLDGKSAAGADTARQDSSKAARTYQCERRQLGACPVQVSKEIVRRNLDNYSGFWTRFF